MFFYVTHAKCNIKRLPLVNKQKFDKFNVFTDTGWKQNGNVLYKGYCIDQNLNNKVEQKDFSESTGNYVILDFSDNKCEIYHDDSRSFPMFYNDFVVTNLADDSMTPLWFDGSVHFADDKWQYNQRKMQNVIVFDKNHKRYKKEDIVELYCDYLVKTCSRLPNELPIYCADSNGVDSTVVRSALDYCGIKYKLVKDNSEFYSELGWGYRQLYINHTPHIQATGFCGDEMLLRNPQYAQWLLDADGINLADEFSKIDYSYMKGFFQSKYLEKMQKNKTEFPDRVNGFEHTANVMLNDFQMWHLNNTLTFTPMRNIPIAVECLYADSDAILNQVIHAGISKDIIKKLNPSNLETLSKHKNNYE